MRGGCECVCSQALLPADMHKMGMRISGATGKAKLKVGGHHAFLGQLLSCFPGSVLMHKLLSCLPGSVLMHDSYCPTVLGQRWCMTVIVVPSWAGDSYCRDILGQRWSTTVIVVTSWVSAEARQLLSCHPGSVLKRDSYCCAFLGQRWCMTVTVVPSSVSADAWLHVVGTGNVGRILQ